MPRLLLFLFVLLPVALPTRAQQAPPPEPPVRYDTDVLSNDFHRSRRDAVLAALPEHAVAVVFSAPVRNREHDVDFEYRQSSDLYYLTGTHEPASVLLLAPGGLQVDGETVRELLMVPPRDPQREIWEGRRYGAERAAEVLGIEKAVSNERFEEVMNDLLQDGRRRFFHLPLPEGVPEGSELGAQIAFFEEHLARYADGALLRQTLDRLRMVKTEEELTLLQRAIDITVAAHREAMRSLEPGMHEYEIEALIEYVFKRNGAEYPGFPSIVGSGENATVLHYTTSRRAMEAGDLVVIDVGAEYRGYAADVTRTLPVDGTFSPEQQAIYALVLEAQEAGIEAARAGSGFSAPGQAAQRVIAEGLKKLGLIEDEAGVRRFFMHGTSHYLGLYVHDVGDYGLLVPGTVITVEPGIYIAPAPDVDAKWWNIGVRIEDDVLITEGAPVNLSEGAPRTVSEIEVLMQERGLGNDDAGRVPAEVQRTTGSR